MRRVGRQPNPAAVLALERVREQLGAADLVLWSAAGQPLGSAGMSRFDLTPERPNPAQLRSLRTVRVMAQIEGLEEGMEGDLEAVLAAGQARIKVLALVSSPDFGIGAEPRYLQVVAPLPAALVRTIVKYRIAENAARGKAMD